MNRRCFIQNATITGLLSQLSAHSQSESPIRERTNTTSGFTAHYDLSLRRVLHGNEPRYTPAFLLADVIASGGRRFTNFSGDLSGRYLGALSAVAQQRGIYMPGVDELAIQIVSLQHTDGYFGASFNFCDPKDDDLALLWGNGRMLIGLLEYYDYRRIPMVLSAARKLGNFLVRIGPLMNSVAMRDRFDANHYATSYICWTQALEGLVRLYRYTNDMSYARLSSEIANLTTYRAGEHAHGFLTSLRGIYDLYCANGDRSYLQKVEKEWQNIATSNNMLLTGGVPERWAPLNIRTEGCAEADWIRLSLALWRATSDEQYLLAAERAIFNEFQMNHFNNGDFGHRVITKTGMDGANPVRAWWCCSLHGLRCFPEIERNAFRVDNGVVVYDIPISASVSYRNLSITSVSSIERNASVILSGVSGSGSEETTLRVRVPSWTEGVELRLNGAPFDSEQADGYLTIRRHWRPADRLELRYKLSMRRERKDTNGPMALYYGPWLLGLDRLDSEPYFNEESDQNTLGRKRIDLIPTRESSSSLLMESPFLVPASHFSVSYVQAEYPMQPSSTTLRPVCEQTRMPSTDWHFHFHEGDD